MSYVAKCLEAQHDSGIGKFMQKNTRIQRSRHQLSSIFKIKWCNWTPRSDLCSRVYVQGLITSKKCVNTLHCPLQECLFELKCFVEQSAGDLGRKYFDQIQFLK